MDGPNLSVITPTHDPRYLLETYRSLRVQHYENWEWLIAPNRPGLIIPEEITDHLKVRVIEGMENSLKIGELKRGLCEAAKGDAFVELDHDDLLHPQALTDVARLIQDGAGFVYSDCARFTTDKSGAVQAQPMSATHGWESYPYELNGVRLQATRAFPPTARSLCEVYYAPDHLRAWEREAYFLAGGHDPALAVCDDIDLMQRTYMAGVPFAQIQDCRYAYRLHESNTFAAQQETIREQTARMRRTRLRGLIQEWCRRETLDMLDLSNDIRSTDDVRKLVDDGFSSCQLEGVGYVLAEHIWHLVPRMLVPGLLRRIYEVLAPGGWLETYHFDSSSEAAVLYANIKPGHFPHLTSSLFVPFSDESYASSWQPPGFPRTRFQLVDRWSSYPSARDADYDFAYVRAFLCALKGQRQPGPQLI